MHVVPSGSQEPLIPKMHRSPRGQFTSMMVRQKIVIFLGTIATPSCVHYFFVVSMQLGRTDPFCDPTLIFVVEAFGSVKHEGPYYRHAADWRDLPGVVRRGLHVVLPCIRWSNVF